MALKHSAMTLYSGYSDTASHRVRIVLAEKGTAANIVYVDKGDLPDELLSLNPYGALPTLIDRDLVLYDPNIICEYLDERFPHPPLLPIYPVVRAKCRLIIHRIEEDWLSIVDRLQRRTGLSTEEREHLIKDLRDQLIAIAPIFLESPYFVSEEFTLADCCLATMFWRLKSIGVVLPGELKPVFEYMKRLFMRETFRASLSPQELAITSF